VRGDLKSSALKQEKNLKSDDSCISFENSRKLLKLRVGCRRLFSSFVVSQGLISYSNPKFRNLRLDLSLGSPICNFGFRI